MIDRERRDEPEGRPGRPGNRKIAAAAFAVADAAATGDGQDGGEVDDIVHDHDPVSVFPAILDVGLQAVLTAKRAGVGDVRSLHQGMLDIAELHDSRSCPARWSNAAAEVLQLVCGHSRL